MAAAGSPGYKSVHFVICSGLSLEFHLEASYSSLCVMLLNSSYESWWHQWLNTV